MRWKEISQGRRWTKALKIGVAIFKSRDMEGLSILGRHRKGEQQLQA